jgi:hypothetical protein
MFSILNIFRPARGVVENAARLRIIPAKPWGETLRAGANLKPELA